VQNTTENESTSNVSTDLTNTNTDSSNIQSSNLQNTNVGPNQSISSSGYFGGNVGSGDSHLINSNVRTGNISDSASARQGGSSRFAKQGAARNSGGGIKSGSQTAKGGAQTSAQSATQSMPSAKKSSMIEDIIIGVVILILLGGGAYLWYAHSATPKLFPFSSSGADGMPSLPGGMPIIP